MSLRVRLGLAAGVAVAVAVVAVAVSAYAGTRSELRDRVDDSLGVLAQPLLIRAGVIRPPHDGPRGPEEPGAEVPLILGAPLAFPGAGTPTANDCDQGLGIDRRAAVGFGAASGYVELLSPAGRPCLARGESVAIAPTARMRALARGGSGQLLSESHAGGVHLRVLATGVGFRGALLVALPLTETDDALSSELLRLLITAAGGIALAALLGVLVARTALAPIARFTRQTEDVARPDRIGSERLEVRGRDELSRLARTFNATLYALDRSVQAQRNLVADASHELRTPIASIRANLQLLRDEAMLSAEDRESLRGDVIAELDELTALVGDVVELARGREPASSPGDARLDEIVLQALERARRRAVVAHTQPAALGSALHARSGSRAGGRRRGARARGARVHRGAGCPGAARRRRRIHRGPLPHRLCRGGRGAHHGLVGGFPAGLPCRVRRR